jgi:hypothetical protein
MVRVRNKDCAIHLGDTAVRYSDVASQVDVTEASRHFDLQGIGNCYRRLGFRLVVIFNVEIVPMLVVKPR